MMMVSYSVNRTFPASCERASPELRSPRTPRVSNGYWRDLFGSPYFEALSSYHLCLPNICALCGALAPPFPKRLAPPSPTYDHCCLWLCRAGSREIRRRLTKGTHMDPNLRRRNGGRPRVPHRPRNGTGNPKQHYERYLTKAREAQQAGDEIEMENCYQHAEHYFRVMRAAAGT